MALKGKNISKKYIEVHGQIGEFSLPHKSVKIRYFSTVVNNKDIGSDEYRLLKELKPVRERVKANRMKDLNSLLQRNLNDFRVAHELIPYLAEELPPISFFPAILCVLLPKGFLAEEALSHYPIHNTLLSVEGGRVLSYDDLWNLEYFKVNDIEVKLGMLQMDSSKVDVVVLDGQHRANAFRVLTGAYTDTDGSIFSAFYKDIKTVDKFQADLPVTIIWFDVDKPTFDPKVVSRRLFVDVNNLPKRVSKARSILMDEYEIPSLMTRFLYSWLAKNSSYSPQRFSLLHSDFDIDSDIDVSSSNAFAITNPQVVYDVHSWLALGSKTYNSLAKYEVSREAFRSQLVTFGEIFRSADFSESDLMVDDDSFKERRVVLRDVTKVKAFEAEYEKTLGQCITALYEKYILFAKHYEACAKIEESALKDMDTTEQQVWNDVFKGGEGLFYTFKDRQLDVGASSGLQRYLKGIKQIEQRFRKERAALFIGIDAKEVDRAYETLSSKAFQIGLFMALDVYRQGAPYEDSFEDYVDKLNSISAVDWIRVLTAVRKTLVPTTRPKIWPTFQKLLLRLVQDENNRFYEASNFRDSPDGRIFANAVRTSFEAWYELQETAEPGNLKLSSIGKAEVRRWGFAAKKMVDELFVSVGVPPMEGVDSEEEAKAVVLEEIEKLT